MDLVIHASFEKKVEWIEGDIQKQNQAEMTEGNFHQRRGDNCYLDEEVCFLGMSSQEEGDMR